VKNRKIGKLYQKKRRSAFIIFSCFQPPSTRSKQTRGTLRRQLKVSSSHPGSDIFPVGRQGAGFTIIMQFFRGEISTFDNNGSALICWSAHHAP